MFKQLKDKRWWKFLWQRWTRGWDDSDTWALDGVIAKFTLPRLRRFRQLTFGHPHGLTMDEWEEIIDDMIYALEICEKELDTVVGHDGADWNRVNRGLELFGLYFRDLWW